MVLAENTIAVIGALLLTKTAAGSADALVAEGGLVTLLTGDVARRNPLARGPGLEAIVTVHEVDILQRQAARLVEEEPHENTGSEIAGGEDESKVVGDALVGKGAEETNED